MISTNDSQGDSNEILSPKPLKHTMDYKDIHLEIVYNPGEDIYSALIQKGNELYIPHETLFVAHSWTALVERISVEMRNSDLQNFIGILNKNKIMHLFTQAQEVFC